MAGTITFVERTMVGSMMELQYNIVADGSDASYPTAFIGLIAGHLTMVTIMPGSAAPTEGWSVELIDDHGFDMLQGICGALTNDVNQQFVITHPNSELYPLIHCDPLITIAGNLVNGADAQLFFTFHLEGHF